MTYYILCRTQMGALIAIQRQDGDGIAEFENKEMAEKAANDNMHCLSGNYSIEECEL